MWWGGNTSGGRGVYIINNSMKLTTWNMKLQNCDYILKIMLKLVSSKCLEDRFSASHVSILLHQTTVYFFENEMITRSETHVIKQRTALHVLIWLPAIPNYVTV